MADDEDKDAGTSRTSRTSRSTSDAAPTRPPLPTEVTSATEPEATEAYNRAHVKPPAAGSDVGGPVRFTREAGPDAAEVDLLGLVSSGQATVVTLPHDVYEEFPAPGAPDQLIRRKLFHRNQQVPIRALQAHAERAGDASGQSKSYRPVTETK